MPITAIDAIGPILSDKEIKDCLTTAQILLNSMQDRGDLHSRGILERFFDIVMGEVAEYSVIRWIQSQGKFAESAVDKKSGQPDSGHDIILHSKDGKEIRCSVKSSLSVCFSNVERIIEKFNLSSKKSEIRDVNIQVYFWLNLASEPRINVPSNKNMAIIGWLGRNDMSGLEEGSYATEPRTVMKVQLKQMRSMSSLLSYLQ